MAVDDGGNRGDSGCEGEGEETGKRRNLAGEFRRGLADRGEEVGDVAGEEFGREEGKSGDHRGRQAGILGNRGDEGE